MSLQQRENNLSDISAAQNIISFVVIGYNEGANLGACIQSIRDMESVPSVEVEIIYVDGGSQDGSISIAEASGVNLVLGGDKRRRAAENRNLGLQAAKGHYVQFLDGDMTLAPDWPQAAIAFLDCNPDVAAVCGKIIEKRTGVWYKAFQLDWGRKEGSIRYCGGAALFRNEIISKVGGFPEDIEYGEEPYLCWRIRNELGKRIHYLDRCMVTHDLALKGFCDYWRRNVRVGRTYEEITFQCMHSSDPLWLRESAMNLVWGGGILLILLGVVFLSGWWRALMVVGLAVPVVRKAIQKTQSGIPVSVAFAYGIHTYFVKIPVGLGQMTWLMDWAVRKGFGRGQ